MCSCPSCCRQPFLAQGRGSSPHGATMELECTIVDGDAPDPEFMLLAFGSNFFLFSPVTGEMQQLDGQGPHELLADEQNDGAMTVFSGPQRAKALAADLMSLRLHRDVDGTVMVSAPESPHQPLSELRAKYTTLAISIIVGGDASNLPRLDCETYHFAASVLGWTVFWLYGFVTDAIGLTVARHLRYNTMVSPWKAKLAELLEFVDATGTETDDHFRVSFRAAWARGHTSTDDMGSAAGHDAMTQEPDHSCSSFALVVVLAHYACKLVHGRRATNVTPEEIQLRSQCIFSHIVRAFVKHDTEFAYAFQDGMEVNFKIFRSCRIGSRGRCSKQGALETNCAPASEFSRCQGNACPCSTMPRPSARPPQIGAFSHGAQLGKPR